MPLISEFPIAGPQGKQGPIGPQGKQGPEGKRGPMGPAGPGTGDMLAMVYDPQGKAIDVYKYTDDAVAGRADLTLSNLSNKQKALRNIGGRPNRNLLDNWYFVGGGSQQGGGQFPINQRGVSGTGDVAIYKVFIDRWNNGVPTGEWTLTAAGLQTTETGNIYQINPAEICAGETITVSLLTSEGLFFGTITVPSLASWPTSRTLVTVCNAAGAGINAIYLANKNIQVDLISKTAQTFIAAKLELGPTQTLAYQDEEGNWQLFETPDYAEELAKCQRYYARYGIAAGNGQIGYTMAAIPTIANAIIFLPGPMRIINPTVRFSGTVALRSGVTDIPVSGMTINAVINNAAYIQVTASGLESGKMYVLRISNGYIDFDADL